MTLTPYLHSEQDKAARRRPRLATESRRPAVRSQTFSSVARQSEAGCACDLPRFDDGWAETMPLEAIFIDAELLNF
jgi:hypothetical protein